MTDTNPDFGDKPLFDALLEGLAELEPILFEAGHRENASPELTLASGYMLGALMKEQAKLENGSDSARAMIEPVLQLVYDTVKGKRS